jgi:tripartite-type tricarboxylate transporter receptor subunit TctC
MDRRNLLKLGLIGTATALAAPRAFAQGSFPSRPIKLVVPFSAGGVNDIVGRQWAERMKPVLGSVYVENVGRSSAPASPRSRCTRRCRRKTSRS